MGLPAPKALMSMASKIAGPDPEMSLASTRAMPKVALDAGFRWKYPGLEGALRNLLCEKEAVSPREKVSVM